jgi:hypothetical protein
MSWKTEQFSYWVFFHLSPKTVGNFVFTENPLDFLFTTRSTHCIPFFLLGLPKQGRYQFSPPPWFCLTTAVPRPQAHHAASTRRPQVPAATGKHRSGALRARHATTLGHAAGPPLGRSPRHWKLAHGLKKLMSLPWGAYPLLEMAINSPNRPWPRHPLPPPFSINSVEPLPPWSHYPRSFLSQLDPWTEPPWLPEAPRPVRPAGFCDGTAKLKL